MSSCAIVSFRFGPADGVSVVSAGWARILRRLGYEVSWVAGLFEEGWAEPGVATTVAGLGVGDATPPDMPALEAVLGGADLVVVENLCTIPLNLPASRAVAGLLRGRPAVMHHHDPPWQRPHFQGVTELPPRDPAWVHVTVNRRTRREMAERGIEATTIYNGFDPDPDPGDREGTRQALGLADGALLVVHPVRALPRKAVDRAIALTEAVGGTYWLLGPAEDGFGPDLAGLLAAARCPVVHAPTPSREDAYAAADLVAFPSTWEGFGNPPVEAALHRRPAVVGDYPVAAELRSMGFRWFDPDRPEEVLSWLDDPDQARRDDLLEWNRRVAARNLSLDEAGRGLQALLQRAGWLP